MLRTIFASTLITATALAAGQAAAQSAYTPTGIGMGGFRLYPELDVGVGYTDNVFATNANEESDLRYTIAPRLRLESEWSTHALDFELATPGTIYSDFSDQNTLDILASAKGQIDIDRSSVLEAELSYRDAYEPLWQGPATLLLPAKPVHFTAYGASGSLAKTINRMQLSTLVSYSDYDYEDERNFAGVLIDQDDRDHSVLNAAIRAGYSVSAATSLFVSVAGNQYEYDQSPPAVTVDRSSTGYEVIGGVAFEISNLVTGEVGAGYLSQTYDAPGVDDTDGLAAHASIRWQPDELVALTFEFDRTIQAAGVENAVSATSNAASVGLDYAFRRNIDMNLKASYVADEYNNIDREDDRWSLEAGAAYYLNRGFGVYTRLVHDELETSGLVPGREYALNRAEIGIRLRR